MSAGTEAPIASEPPIFKQVLVGLLVGITMGPLIGWFVGTFATFFIAAVANPAQRRVGTGAMRVTAFAGGMIGILLGLIVGPMVSLPIRLLSSVSFKFLRNPWTGAALGAVVGIESGLLIHLYWRPSPEAFVYTMIHAVTVGAVVGAATTIAKPKWL